MEDGLVLSSSSLMIHQYQVLILVVMEDGLVHAWYSCIKGSGRS